MSILSKLADVDTRDAAVWDTDHPHGRHQQHCTLRLRIKSFTSAASVVHIDAKPVTDDGFFAAHQDPSARCPRPVRAGSPIHPNQDL